MIGLESLRAERILSHAQVACESLVTEELPSSWCQIPRNFCEGCSIVLSKNETHLNKTSIISCNHQFSIPSDTCAPCDIFEPGYCLCYFLCARCVYLYASSSCDSISVRFYWRKVYPSYWCVFLYEYRMLELPPITRFCRSFRWWWFGVFFD